VLLCCKLLLGLPCEKKGRGKRKKRREKKEGGEGRLLGLDPRPRFVDEGGEKEGGKKKRKRFKKGEEKGRADAASRR